MTESFTYLIVLFISVSDENQTSLLPYTEENFTDYSIKVIEYLCKAYRKAVDSGPSIQFDIDEIWSQGLKAIIGDDNRHNFLKLLTKIQEKTGYLEIQGNIVRLAEAKNTICAEVGIILDQSS